MEVFLSSLRPYGHSGVHPLAPLSAKAPSAQPASGAAKEKKPGENESAARDRLGERVGRTALGNLDHGGVRVALESTTSLRPNV
jgi:hypothetical protein